MSVRSGAQAVVVTGLATCALLLGCGRGARTPEEAYTRFVQAVRARDGVQLFFSLDLDSRWSWMTVRRCHREAYDIVLSNVPEGPERARQLQRFAVAALSEDEAALFAALLDERRWTELERGLAEGARVTATGENEASATTADGRALTFRRTPNGRWGFAGLAEEAEQSKRRALADLELIRADAADYERAATRGGR